MLSLLLRRACLPLALALPLTVIASSCGDEGPAGESTAESEATGRALVIASPDLAVGKQRLAFVVLENDLPVSEKPVFVRIFRDAATTAPKLVGEVGIPWAPLGAEEDQHGGPEHVQTELSGVYFVNLEFDAPGAWGIGVTVGEKFVAAEEVRVQFSVAAVNVAPALGSKAIPVTNPTSATHPLKQIHTGSEADPNFHSLTVADAITSGRPSVVVFATPSFCRTRTCGPSLQVAMRAEVKFGDDVNFLHLEPYELSTNGLLVEDKDGNPIFQVTKEGLAWRLPTEPWVFVIDAAGLIVARFDGLYALEELEFYLEQLTG